MEEGKRSHMLTARYSGARAYGVHSTNNQEEASDTNKGWGDLKRGSVKRVSAAGGSLQCSLHISDEQRAAATIKHTELLRVPHPRTTYLPHRAVHSQHAHSGVSGSGMCCAAVNMGVPLEGEGGQYMGTTVLVYRLLSYAGVADGKNACAALQQHEKQDVVSRLREAARAAAAEASCSISNCSTAARNTSCTPHPLLALTMPSIQPAAASSCAATSTCRSAPASGGHALKSGATGESVAHTL